MHETGSRYTKTSNNRIIDKYWYFKCVLKRQQICVKFTLPGIFSMNFKGIMAGKCRFCYISYLSKHFSIHNLYEKPIL